MVLSVNRSCPSNFRRESANNKVQHALRSLWATEIGQTDGCGMGAHQNSVTFSIIYDRRFLLNEMQGICFRESTIFYNKNDH